MIDRHEPMSPRMDAPQPLAPVARPQSSVPRSRRLVQAKLVVGRADDRFEREADAVSDQIMASFASLRPAATSAGDGPLAVVRGPRSSDRPSRIRRSLDVETIGLGGGDLDEETSARIRRTSGGGARLDPATRAAMESGFGADFSAVRIHADRDASVLNRQLQARAFTVDRDVFFDHGQYDPSSHAGRRLLAHELTHVVQQGGAPGLLPDAEGTSSRIRRSTAWGAPAISRDASPVVRRAHDSYNLARLERARAIAIQRGLCTEATKLTAVRLDHTMSDLNLQTLAKTLTGIWGRVADERSPFELCRTAMVAVRKAIGGLGEAQLHPDWSAGVEGLSGLLVNLRANLTPGLTLTTGNPGSDFDPAVELAVGGVIQSSDASDALFKLDKAATAAAQLGALLPSGAIPKRNPPYNADLDTALADQLDKIEAAIGRVGAAAEEGFDANLWEATLTAGKYVKKPAGARLPGAAAPPNFRTNLNSATPGNVVASNMDWTIPVPGYSMGNGGQDVDVDVDIDMAAWRHIYDRHTLERFGVSQPNQVGKVEATNTFWTGDPFTVIDQAMLEPEINLMVNRRFDLQAIVRNGTPRDFANINGTARYVFIQATMNLTQNQYGVSIAVRIKSLAPQHHTLGKSVAPTDLQHW